MVGHSYATDVQSEAAELAKAILSAASSQQIATVCAGVEHFLQKHTADQARWFFSITFPTLICKIFGFDDSASSSTKPQSPNGWIDTATLSGGSELSGLVYLQLFIFFFFNWFFSSRSIDILSCVKLRFVSFEMLLFGR